MPYGLELNFKVNYNDYNKKIKKGTNISLKKIIIALAGPLTNLIIILLTIILSYFSKNLKFFSYTYQEVIYSNFLIAIFNLLPIYPMDGGRILKELLHIILGLRNSYEIIRNTTLITTAILSLISSFLIIYYKNIAILIIMIYLWGLTIKTQKEMSLKQKITEKISQEGSSMH